MRFVTRKKGKAATSVTGLAYYLTCPLLYLRWSLEKKITPSMRRGAELHRRVYRLHKAEAVEMELEKAVEMSEEHCLTGKEVWVGNGYVGGFIDHLELCNRAALVVEYKSTVRSALWKPSHYQATVYGVLISPFVEEVTVEVRTFDSSIFYRKRLEQRDSELVVDGLNRLIRSIQLGIFLPEPGLHCDLCPFRRDCPVFKWWEEKFSGVRRGFDERGGLQTKDRREALDG